MAHPMNDLINKKEGREQRPCSEECKYFKFPHLETACVLSPVYSVRQGEPCYEFIEEKEKINHAKRRLQ